MQQVSGFRRFVVGVCAVAVFSTAGSSAFAQGEFFIKNGDKVVFYGDSITDSRSYTTPVEAYIVTRFPKIKVDFTHSGWSGDRVVGGGGGNIDTRLARDVFPYKPTVVTVMLGMNDGGYKPFDQATFDTFAKGYQKIVEATKAALPGVRMTLIEPSPFDDVTRAPNFPEGYNAVLQKYGVFVRDLAQQQGQTSADLNAPVVAMLAKANAANPALSQNLIRDRVHPNQGALTMSQALLGAWNAPALVTSTEIDAAGGKIVKADNTTITDFVKDAGLKWTQLDGALPMPVSYGDAATALVLSSSDFVEKLNQQPLKVTGLAPGKYTLMIDGEAQGTFTPEQLATGINLATMQTPMLKQAMQVLSLTNQHLQVHQNRWRGLQVPVESDKSAQVAAAAKTHLQPLLDAFDAEEAEIVTKQREAAQPVARKYELKPD